MAIYVLIAATTKRSTGPASVCVELKSPRELLQAAEMFENLMSPDDGVEIWAIGDYVGTFKNGSLDKTVTGSRLAPLVVPFDELHPSAPWVPDDKSSLIAAENLKPGDVFWALNRPLTARKTQPGPMGNTTEIAYEDEYGGKDTLITSLGAQYYTKPRVD